MKSTKEITWMRDTQKSWLKVRVKSLFHDDTVSISASEFGDLEVSHYSIPSFDEFRAPTLQQGADIASNKTRLKGGELLYSKLNSHKPRVWIVAEDSHLKVASTEFIALRGWWSDLTSTRYYKYVLGSDVFAEYISCFQTSVTNSHKRVSPHDLLAASVPFPESQEQKRIADFLDTSCRALDGAVAAKRAQIAGLSGVFKSILQGVVTQGLKKQGRKYATGNTWLPELPTGWGIAMLKRVCMIQSGLTLGKEYEGELVERPYLRVSNVQDGHLQLESLSRIEVPGHVAERVRLEVGDVLMTEGGDLDKLGRGVVWRGEIPDCLHQNHVFAVRCVPWKLRPQFLAYVSASQYGRDYFEATGKKTTNLAATNSTKVGQFPLPLPSLPEQDELIEFLDAESLKLQRLRTVLEQQIDTLTAYRKSLIHECVTGQRRISDEDVNRVTAHAAQHAHA